MKRYAKEGKIVVVGKEPSGFSDLPRLTRVHDDPARYLQRAGPNLEITPDDAEQKFIGSLGGDAVEVRASPLVATQIAEVDGKVHVFLANFKGLRSKENAQQTPETGAQITVRGRVKGHFLPFLGDEQSLPGKFEKGRTQFILPAIQKGAVVWFEAEK